MNNLKIFISYSHKDEEPFIEEFRSHMAQLIREGLIEIWYDRDVLPGKDFDYEIDDHINDAELICLFISANFLSSEECIKEVNKALELKRKKGIHVVPIILSSCGWKDDENISRLLALPRDGKTIKSFEDRNEGWLDVYTQLRKTIEKEIKIKQLKIDEKFYDNFLQDTVMLTKANSQKERVILDDIFVYPELDKYDFSQEFEEKISSKELLKNIINYSKIVVAGEDQSGKTTLGKTIFKFLRNDNFVPVYINAKNNSIKKNIESTIHHIFPQQYKKANISGIDKRRLIPIIDNFHYVNNKESIINELSTYSHFVVFVDDIYDINIEDEKFMGSFARFKIREFKPSLRYELINKWVSLTDKKDKINDIYKNIDDKSRLINFILGKSIGRGIMPSYPFFILSSIVYYETFEMPLDQEITSQGYCYQALIYYYLRKQNVKNDEINIYINFLTELAFYIYKENKLELSKYDFDLFMEQYLEKFNLPIASETLLKKLRYILDDTFNNYSFRYQYLLFFFISKYLADNIEDTDVNVEIGNIIKNLHVDENAYIAIFLAHNSKNNKIIEKIEDISSSLFKKYEPSTLKRTEVNFFDEQASIIVGAVLSPNSAEMERKKRLEIEDKLEENENLRRAKGDDETKGDDEDNSLNIDLRRAIKTVEVIGCIIKNRSGSLEKIKLEHIFEEAMNVQLRVVSSFFEFITNEDGQKEVIEVISKYLKKVIDEGKGKMKEPNDEDLRSMANTIFWNLNFLLVTSIINKIVHSLGSDKLLSIVNKVCDEIDTPASLIVKQGIFMWYNQNLNLGEIDRMFKRRDFSKIAKMSIRSMIVDYCSVHQVSYKERQILENKFNFERKELPFKSDVE